MSFSIANDLASNNPSPTLPLSSFLEQQENSPFAINFVFEQELALHNNISSTNSEEEILLVVSHEKALFVISQEEEFGTTDSRKVIPFAVHGKKKSNNHHISPLQKYIRENVFSLTQCEDIQNNYLSQCQNGTINLLEPTSHTWTNNHIRSLRRQNILPRLEITPRNVQMFSKQIAKTQSKLHQKLFYFWAQIGSLFAFHFFTVCHKILLQNKASTTNSKQCYINSFGFCLDSGAS